ncbi:MAG: DNA-directed RNA polymerase subunit omega [Candidatus Aminicenantes bacterium]|nr:DNA-directed RNA polymerase subunit omega [Candidatus Aminicenantes bacterium]
MEDHKVVDSKFRLVLLAAKRAKQLLKGSRKKVETQVENPLSIALEEINQGKIDFEILSNKDLEQEAGENLLMMEAPESTELNLSETKVETESELVDSKKKGDDDSDSENKSGDD